MKREILRTLEDMSARLQFYVAGCYDGIPPTAKKRLDAAKRLINEAHVIIGKDMPDEAGEGEE